MFEKRHEPLATQATFQKRLFNNGLITFGILSISLALGVIGYHYLCGLKWIDSLLNASMILSGMGPVDGIANDIGKIFASFYAIFSGVVFITSVGFLLSPVLHRFFHHFFHLEEK